MSILVAVIIVIILLLAGILLIPFRLSLSVVKDGTYLQGFYKISYLGFTLIKEEIHSPQPETIKEVEEPEETEEAREAKILEKSEETLRKYHKEPDRVASGEADKEIDREQDTMRPPVDLKLMINAFPRIAHILIDLIRSIDIDRLCCKLSFGLDDPVDTAMMSGYLWSIVYATGLYRADVFIEPRFDRVQLDGSLLIDLDARALWAVVAAVKALEDKTVRKLILKVAKGEMT